MAETAAEGHIVALVVFLVGSVLCSLAWSADSLIIFRIVQGLGGGLLMPLFSTMIMQAAAGRALGRTMSIVTLPFVIGPIIDPLIGGVILKGLDWRWLFWVNVPFCVAGFILAWRMVEADATNERPSIPLQAAAFVGLQRDEIPHAGIISRVAQQVGGSFGVAVLAVILDAALRHLGTDSPSAAQSSTAFDQAFWWAVGFTGLALVLSLMLPGRTLDPTPEAIGQPARDRQARFSSS